MLPKSPARIVSSLRLDRRVSVIRWRISRRAALSVWPDRTLPALSGAAGFRERPGLSMRPSNRSRLDSRSSPGASEPVFAMAEVTHRNRLRGNGKINNRPFRACARYPRASSAGREICVRFWSDLHICCVNCRSTLRVRPPPVHYDNFACLSLPSTDAQILAGFEDRIRVADANACIQGLLVGPVDCCDL